MHDSRTPNHQVQHQASWFQRTWKGHGILHICFSCYENESSLASQIPCQNVLWMRVKHMVANKLDKWVNIHNHLSILSFVKEFELTFCIWSMLFCLNAEKKNNTPTGFIFTRWLLPPHGSNQNHSEYVFSWIAILLKMPINFKHTYYVYKLNC